MLTWGLLGADSIGSLRRTRTLELGAVVRRFNNLAVPGMGNVWYAKQIYLAALGIAVAEKVRDAKGKYSRQKNIEVANAIEAVANYLSFEKNNWSQDRRLKGINKLKGKDSFSFEKVKRPGYYITQPMRMGTVQVLLALELVNSGTIRFNSFSLTSQGEFLINAVSEKYSKVYRNYGVVDFLEMWVKGEVPEAAILNSDNLRKSLSPLEKLDISNRTLIRNIILRQGEVWAAERRTSIMTWMDEEYIQSKGHSSWEKKPASINHSHWQDLKAGALFFKTRDIALKILDQLEKVISRSGTNKISFSQADKAIADFQDQLCKAAADFLKMQYDPTNNKEATQFCNECIDRANSIRRLVERDGLGLRLKGESIVPGPAFKGDAENRIEMDEDFDYNEEITVKLPEFISQRVYNMFYLNQDLNGRLNQWV